MLEYVLLECPHCEARRAVPKPEADSDGTVRTAARHLLSAHPGVGATADGPTIERMLDDPPIHESEVPLDELGWTTEPFPAEKRGSAADTSDCPD